MEAGKGLEMRKLVLSGFLASEEIYINQLEALLLVSIRSGLLVSVMLETWLLGSKKKGDLGQSISGGRVCTGLLTSWHWAAGVIARKGLVPLSPSPPLPALGKMGEAHPVWRWQTLPWLMTTHRHC